LRDHRLKPPAAVGRWSRAWRAWLSQAELGEQSRWIVDRQLRHLQYVEQEICEVENHLDGVTAEDPVVQDLLKKEQVGPVTAWTLRAEIGRFDRFRTGRQLSRFCGLSPRNASSGARQADAGLIRAGNSQLRAVLMELSHRLIRQSRRWTKMAIRLLEGGKAKNVVVAAVANRWMRRLFYQMQPAPPPAPARQTG
ncbi:unnamed protein product, partial [marine sediment metagenome]